ncbi:MAG: hypothetical protein GYA42_07555 [Syntrophomonadaceae bacterium]|nr:hypothetical protein [Syntrophomonadaceae bacterium]
MNYNQESLSRDFSIIENTMEKMWDMWLVSLGSLSWTQEHLENLTRRQLDQNQAAREEFIKMVEELSNQMRRNQFQFRMMVEESMMNTYEKINYTSQTFVNDLSKKADELALKIGNKKEEIPAAAQPLAKEKRGAMQAQA